MSLARSLALALVRKLLPEATDPGTSLALRRPAQLQLPGPPGHRQARTVYPERLYAPPPEIAQQQPVPLAPPTRRRKVTVTETIYIERR